MELESLIFKLSKKTNLPKYKIIEIIENISNSLLKEGCPVNSTKFTYYLTRRLKKKLKIEESNIYKTFKEFFKDETNEKG